MTIGERIKLLRQKLNLQQEEFAQRLGVSQSFISLIEKDKKTPSDKLLRLISHTFGVSYEWLKEGKGEMWEREVQVEPSIQLSLIVDIVRELKKIEEEYDIDIPPDLFATAVETIYDEVMKELRKGETDRQKLIKRGVGKIIKLAG